MGVIPRALAPVGIRSLLGITDCHAPSVLAMTTGTKQLAKSEFGEKRKLPEQLPFCVYFVFQMGLPNACIRPEVASWISTR